jgi:hypothetical protein
MKTVQVTYRSDSPYAQGRPLAPGEFPKKDKESCDDYEKRSWPEKAHIDKDGNAFIPTIQLRNSVIEAAAFLGQKIKGKGQSTWTKHFQSGLTVLSGPIMLGVKKADLVGKWMYVPSDGKIGGGKRVWRCFPVFESWGGTVEFAVLDDEITKEAFKYHVEQAGLLIGIGSFRVRNRGWFGRYTVTKVDWKELA